MQIQLTTPSILFPAISLLMLAYTNRFLGLSAIIRQLHTSHAESPKPVYLQEINNLRRRVLLIRDMQFWGVLSLLLCTVCMFFLFIEFQRTGEIFFAVSIFCMIVSLALSLVEIRMSVNALDLHLKDIEKSGREKI